MSLTNSSLPIQTVSNTSSNYFVTVQNFTQGQTDKETVSSSLLWKNNNLLIDSEKVKFLPTSNAFTTFTTSGTPPRNPKPDDTWYDTASDIIFRYIDDGDGTFQWVDVSSLSNFGDLIPRPPYEGFYLVVAGGGGGANGPNMSGGGGAGGLLTGSATFTAGVTYTISVGGGGGRGGPGAIDATNGASSNISGPGFATVDTIGGGRGQGVGATTYSASPGGSGGGACRNGGAAFGTGANFPGPTQQGFPGGSGFVPQNSAGGGGGAGGVGLNGSPTGGTGGAGVTWVYTGPAVFYAGGGGGGTQGASRAPGGSGVGGTGGGGPLNFTGCAGTNGRGGGGGGSGGNSGGAGGSGTVILAIPTAAFAEATPGGATVTNPPAAPGLTVLTYTAVSPLTPSTFTFTA
jgi:hypothetical protein